MGKEANAYQLAGPLADLLRDSYFPNPLQDQLAI
jgi:hypothetical protein